VISAAYPITRPPIAEKERWPMLDRLAVDLLNVSSSLALTVALIIMSLRTVLNDYELNGISLVDIAKKDSLTLTKQMEAIHLMILRMLSASPQFMPGKGHL
jgi:hypothetical protein